jgi:hypothetical protein
MTPLIVTAPDHYDRHKRPRLLTLAQIHPSTFLHCAPSEVLVLNRSGEAVRVRITGKTRTWKRTPRIVIPWKYGHSGTAEYGHFDSPDGQSWVPAFDVHPGSHIPYRLLSASDDEKGA